MCGVFFHADVCVLSSFMLVCVCCLLPCWCVCVVFFHAGVVHVSLVRYFAAGSADALTSLWDVSELTCIQMFSRLEYVLPQVTYSFLFKFLACLLFFSDPLTSFPHLPPYQSPSSPPIPTPPSSLPLFVMRVSLILKICTCERVG